MQQFLVDALLRAMADSRLQDLIQEFYSLREHVVTRNRIPVETALQTLLDAIRGALDDCIGEAQLLDKPTDALLNARQSVENVRPLVLGPAFADTTVLLYLFRRKLSLDEDAEKRHTTAEVIGRLEELLTLLGISEFSLSALWNSASGELNPKRRDVLEQSVWRLVTIIGEECALKGSPAR